MYNDNPIVHEPSFIYLSGKRRRRKRMLICSLSTWRLLKGLKQSELAQRVGVTRATISQIENNRQIPTLDVALAIAEALDMEVGTIFQLSGRT